MPAQRAVDAGRRLAWLAAFPVGIGAWLALARSAAPEHEHALGAAHPPPSCVAIAAPAAPASPERTSASAVGRVPETHARGSVAASAPGELQLPDGSKVATLNGVTRAPALAWGDRPWSPIVARASHDGVDWYQHANGSWSTTRMVWRSDLGREDAATQCVHPVAPAPTPPPPPPPLAR